MKTKLILFLLFLPTLLFGQFRVGAFKSTSEILGDVAFSGGTVTFENGFTVTGGTITISVAINTTSTFEMTSDGDTLRMNMGAALNVFDIEVNNSTIFVVDSTGNVQVGNDNAEAKITIDKASAGESVISFTRTNGTAEDWKLYTNAGEDFTIEGVRIDEDFAIKVNDGGVLKTVLFGQGTTGNVCIGCTAPVTLLDIHGTLTTGNDVANVSGQIDFVASDGNAASIAINTSDQLSFTGAVQYVFSNTLRIVDTDFDISQSSRFGLLSGFEGITLNLSNDLSSGSPFNLDSGSGDELTASSGTQSWLSIEPKINQTSTAGYNGIFLDVTETGTGSGAKNLMDLQVGSVSKFKVDNAGVADAVTLTEGGVAVPNVNDNLSVFASTSSSQFFGVISDETGTTGLVVTSIDPTFTNDIQVDNDVLMADGGKIGITGNEEITFTAAGAINITGATHDVDGAFTASSVVSDGLITANGAFTSPGIDDNADAIAITIDVTTEKVNMSADLDVVNNLTVGDIIVDESAGVLDFSGATSGTISATGSGTVSIATGDNFSIVGGAITQRTNVITDVVNLTGATDNTATNFFTVTTTDESGSADGGSYICYISLLASEGVAASGATNVASRGLEAHFTRVMASAGTGSNSGMAEIDETDEATEGTGTLTTVTLTIVETSEFIQTIQLLVDTSGGTFDGFAEIRVVYNKFTTAPVIAGI